MKPEDKTEFAACAGVLAITFNQPMSAERVESWWLALRDLELHAFKTAVMRGQRESRFMPSPAELRELAGELTPEQRSAVAWDAIRGNLRGDWSLDCDDPIVLAVIRAMGGRNEVDDRMGQEPSWCFKDFSRFYSLFFRAGISDGQARRLPGNTEIHWNVQAMAQRHQYAATGSGDAEQTRPEFPVKLIRTNLPLPQPRSRRLSSGVGIASISETTR